MDHPIQQKPEKRSRFLNQTLTPDEFVVRKGEFHWLYTAGACIKGGIWVVLGFLGAFLLTKYGPEAATASGKPAMFVPLFGMLIGGAIFLAIMVRKWTTEIILTNRRFLYKTGVFKIAVTRLNMHEINYCNINQTLIGSWMNYGQIYMYTHTLDDKNINLPELAEPHAFTTEIENLKRAQY